MRINWKLVSGALFAALLYDGHVQLHNNKQMSRLIKSHTSANELNGLLIGICERNNVEVDDFEVIVLNDLMENIK